MPPSKHDNEPTEAKGKSAGAEKPPEWADGLRQTVPPPRKEGTPDGRQEEEKGLAQAHAGREG